MTHQALVARLEGSGDYGQEASVPTASDDAVVTSDLLSAAIDLRQRLHAFVCAVAEYTDCGPDVEAIKRADVAIARARGAA